MLKHPVFLTAFSLLISSSSYAKGIEWYAPPEPKQENEKEEILERAASAPSKISPEKQEDVATQTLSETEEKQELAPKEKSTPSKKIKPHFVGVRQQNAAEKKKPPSGIENEWIISKTHPKMDNKKNASEKKTEPTPPSDAPYFKKTAIISSPPRTHQITNADQNETALPSAQTQASSQTEMRCDQNPNCVYPLLGTDAPRGHIFFTGDFLYWKSRQGGMEYATQTPLPGVFVGAVTRTLKCDFRSGFRAGLGVHLPHDGWDIYVNYTDFRPRTSDEVEGFIFPLLFQKQPSGTFASSAHGSWDIDFLTLDIEIGRAYYIGKTLSYRPFIGMTGAWINQHARIFYEGGNIPGQKWRIHTHNDFKGAGARVGIDSNWHLGAGFSFFGNLATALLLGHFDLDQTQSQQEIAFLKLNSDLNLLSPMVQLVSGLAWDINFHRDRCHFGLSAGFETQYWWRQNQLERFTDIDAPLFVRASEDLAFYGLTLKGRFDF